MIVPPVIRRLFLQVFFLSHLLGVKYPIVTAIKLGDLRKHVLTDVLGHNLSMKSLASLDQR